MAKQTNKDVGYKAYFAAFAVMLVIIIAAICILSGCLDSIIFKAETPAGNMNDDTDIPPIETPKDSAPSDDPIESDEVKDPADTGDETSPKETEPKPTETTKTPDETTKKPDETTKKPEDTTKKPEETTEKPAETELLESEIISDQDDNILRKRINKILTITGYAGAPTEISISQKFDGVKTLAIGESAFEGSAMLKTVRISAGVKTISSKAFANCTELTYVYIPTTVTEIASDAFSGSDNVVIYCESGSYAEHFASDNAIDCRTN